MEQPDTGHRTPDTVPANPSWSPEVAVASFDGVGPHAQILKMLEAFGRRDLFLNVGYSRRWQRHWGGKAQFRLIDRIAKRLEKIVASKLEPTLLDVGCGRGGPAIRFREEWDLVVTGIDLSDRNVDMARQRTRDLAIHEGLTFRKGDAVRIPFNGETYARVTAIESMEYVRAKRKALSEIQRVLKPGGAVAIATLLTRESTLGSTDNGQVFSQFLSEWDFHDLPTETAYREMFAEVGLKIKKVEIATSRTLRPHHKRLKRALWFMHNPLFYRIIRWYLRRKADVDVDPIRTQLDAVVAVLDAGLIDYGLFWAVKPKV